jgi:hypothetical protein
MRKAIVIGVVALYSGVAVAGPPTPLTSTTFMEATGSRLGIEWTSFFGRCDYIAKAIMLDAKVTWDMRSREYQCLLQEIAKRLVELGGGGRFGGLSSQSVRHLKDFFGHDDQDWCKSDGGPPNEGKSLFLQAAAATGGAGALKLLIEASASAAESAPAMAVPGLIMVLPKESVDAAKRVQPSFMRHSNDGT